MAFASGKKNLSFSREDAKKEKSQIVREHTTTVSLRPSTCRFEWQRGHGSCMKAMQYPCGYRRNVAI
jgi:hypothetical protein